MDPDAQKGTPDILRQSNPRRLDWRDAACAALIAIAVLAGASQRVIPGVVGVFDDDAVYSITARAIASGDGYTLTNLPGHPAQTKYPVLYPAFLSLAAMASSSRDEQLVLMQAMTIALSAIGLAMAYLYVVHFRIGHRAAAVGAGLIVASSPNVLFYCCQTLSEMPFLVALVAALWATESRLRSSDSSATRDLACGIALGLPFLCRLAGVAIPVAAVLAMMRRQKSVRFVAAGAAMVMVPWCLWAVFAGSAGHDSILGYHTDYIEWWRNNGSMFVPVENLLKSGVAFPSIAFEAATRWLYGRIDSPQWLLFSVGILPWMVVAVRARKLELLPVTLLAYLALVCFWPWPPDRFLVPILPFLVAMLIETVFQFVSLRTSARAGRLALATTIAMVVSLNGWMVLQYSSVSRQSHYPYFTMPDAPVAWSDYQSAFEWLSQHTRPGEVVAAGLDTMTALYSDRPTIRPFVPHALSLYYGASDPPLGTAGEMDDTLAKYGARYLLLTPLPSYPMEGAFFDLVYAATDETSSILRPVWQSKNDPRFAIFEVAAKPRVP